MSNFDRIGWLGVASALALLSLASTFRQAGTSEPSGRASPRTPLEEKIQLHDALARIHLDAAKCLRSGVAIDECDRRLKSSCPPGQFPECASLDRAELGKHALTHEMAGTISPGRLPKAEPPPGPSALPPK